MDLASHPVPTGHDREQAGRKRGRSLLPVLLPVLLAYPLLVHFAVVWKEPKLEWLALVVLCAIPQIHGLRALRPSNWLLLLVLAALLYALARSGGGVYVLLLPPVVVPAMMLVLFANSLRADQVPLVTRVAHAVQGDVLQPGVRFYTRRVTELWVLVLATLTIEEIGLALFAPLTVWSLFSNFLNYFFVGLVFVLEYLYRRRRFPEQHHPGLLAHLRVVARFDYRAG